MEKVQYFSVQRVRPSDLNKNTSYFEERINTNMSMLSSKGVIVNATLPDGTVLAPVNGNYLYNGGTSLGVFGLLAYDNLGRVILIPKSTNPDVPDVVNLMPGEGGVLVNNGGSFKSNTTYTIVVRYSERYNESQKADNDKTGIPTNYLVDTSFVLYARENGTILTGDVVLGTVVTNSAETPQITIDETNRDIFKIDQDLIVADVSLPTSEAGSTGVTLSSHINMLGSGTWSVSNPHAISAEDIGIDPTATGKHQQYLHSNGLKSDNISSQTSALYTSYFMTSATSNESVTVRGLSTDNNEIVVVNGVTITPAVLGTDTVFDFSTLNAEDYAGYYICAVSSQSKTVEKYGPFSSETDPLFLDIINNKELFPVCSFYWGHSLYPLYAITLLQQNGSAQISDVFSSEYEFINAYEQDSTADDYYIKAKDLVVYDSTTGIGSLVTYNGTNYWVANKSTTIDELSSYNIDPISIKDRRVFNNTGFDDIRTDTLCAIRDSAPFTNNTVSLYYARITSSEPFTSASVNGTEFKAIINGTYFAYTFQSASEYTCQQIINTLNYQFTNSNVSAKAFLDHNSCLSIVATESIIIETPGSFNERVFFPTTSFADYGEDIKVVFNEGNLPSIQEILYNNEGDISEVHYITNGNTIRSHELLYSGDNIIGVNENVEVI